jgi:hypothetical protein
VCVKRIDVAVFSCVYFNCEVLGRSESLYFEVKISFSSVQFSSGLARPGNGRKLFRPRFY